MSTIERKESHLTTSAYSEELQQKNRLPDYRMQKKGRRAREI